jgi:Zn-dependent M28 family amino/carboxypeptidase
LRVNGQSFTWDKDFVLPLRSLAFGNFTYTNVVFAGYGIVDAEGKINDLNGLDVKGKLVLVLDGSPEGYKPPAGAGRRFVSPASTNGKIVAARTAGAAAVLVVTADFPKKAITPTKGEMYLKPNTNGAVSGTVSASVASAMLGRTKAMDIAAIKSLEKGSYVAEVNIQTEKTVETLESSNVVGIIPGTDKKDEYLFLTGHYDHLGKRGNVIYYGADDDGSGTVGVMQMAEAFAAAAKKGNKPRRTLVFMTVSGEEKGLWGSDYYSEHPIFPLEKTTADLNTDMIGRVDTERKTADTLNYIYVIGHDKLSSELPIINEGMNKKYTNLVLDYKYDDPKDQNQIYYRSDHYNFAKKGVPILFFYDGMLQADYHRPTDTVEKINFELMQKRTKLVFYTAWEMANRDNMLKRDTPLNMPNSR